MRIFSKRRFQADAEVQPQPVPQPMPAMPAFPAVDDDPEIAPMRVRRSDQPVAAQVNVDELVRRSPTGPVNMWDSLDDEDDADGMMTPLPLPTRTTAGRAKTRLLGQSEATDFGGDVFEETAPAEKAVGVKFPVGWLVVASGPGRGTGFALQNGVSQIGRGDDETIPLNFGDTSISRHNHASVAYDSETHDFYIGHGGKLNMVRLNGRPVLSTEKLTTGDQIRIGETILKFIALCDHSFNWDEAQDGAETV